MKFTPCVLSLLLSSTASAKPLAHEHHMHKRDVVTVVHTVYANGDLYTPPAETADPAPQTAGINAPYAPAPDTTAAAAAGTSSAAAGAPSSDSSSSSGSGTSGLSFGAAIVYSPYSSSGGCKDANTIASEIAQLSAYDVIRIYGVDCNQVPNILSALASHQKLFAGIFNMGSLSSDLATLKAGVESTSSWDKIFTVSIGNELVNSGQQSASSMVSYTNQGRSILRGYGYNGPVVTVDTFVAYYNNPSLCSGSDYIAANAHPYFDSTCSASDAGSWVQNHISTLSSLCSGKSVIITETGWPSQGNANGAAVPSVSNQQAALSSINSLVKGQSIILSAFNELWKSPGSCGCEQYWGVLD
ncbi:glycoside hydrolase family 17 protein [Tortispora caseinolytica NRRL Y-17796]|uniref:Glycoside hydrolase family 17 protein n=1 Tax=Tortispora caseinolytica NRRL Y-17796 TaxID=767744 RepID=A0A1E4TJ32_9ASCO|nr:glycoside hydrolase family 17 protein [Tortispora caseinolytica NRRL Y-17796]